MAAVARAASPFAVEAMHGLATYAHVFEAMTLVFAIGAVTVFAATRPQREAIVAVLIARGLNGRAPTSG